MILFVHFQENYDIKYWNLSMSSIFVIVSEQCNLDCDFCCIGRPKNNASLDFDAFLSWFHHFWYDDSHIINFTGGEPILYVREIFNVIKSIKYPKIRYDISTNLTYNLLPEIIDVLESCTVYTSWDPVHLRFKSQNNFEVWKENCKFIKPKTVAVILTNDVLEYDPKKLFEDFVSWSIDCIEFWYLCPVGCAQNIKLPLWHDIDDWLSRAYDVRLKELKVNSFDIILDCLQTQKSSKSNENLIQVDYNGMINIPPTNEGIYQFPKQLVKVNNIKEKNIFSISENIFDKTAYNYNNIEYVKNLVPINCRICWFFRYCGGKYFHKELKDFCAFPKKLFKKIANDNNIVIRDV